VAQKQMQPEGLLHPAAPAYCSDQTPPAACLVTACSALRRAATKH
jgi:hypothetical protein